MKGLQYDSIYKYDVEVQCNGPLRVGSAIGGKEEVLVHPVDGMPFIQASSIAGVFRNYCTENEMDSDKIFGSAKNDDSESGSRIKFSDGIFKSEVKIELRPHVKINKLTGSVSSAEVSGTSKQSGQKFDLEYIGAGSKFGFKVYLYDNSSDACVDDVEQIFAALNSELIVFGGKKSNGAGKVKLLSIKRTAYDLRNPEDMSAWLSDSKESQEYLSSLQNVENKSVSYFVTVKGRTEGAIQVKGIASSTFGKDAPDSENMRNALGEYIVPGSSFKGTIRSRMEQIAEYMNNESVITDSFGCVGKGEKDGHAGNISFTDSVIGDIESNEEMDLNHRIHIDKFTGGVFHAGLFSEKNAAGEITFRINIKNKNNPEKTLGLLMLALRDMSLGLVSVGNGFSTGKGIILVNSIEVKENINDKVAVITFADDKGNIDDESGIIEAALTKLKGDL
ncbi:MAG: RAMP superfamily CRISPR-associated protein [Lachnospiraceae bacterium]|nr:RAMP superfamily CRISPR-associated protein [Lachnospiraceae bacterium]